ncbi:unnamed protein product [Hermetia illucens]|uniref:Uncharacterized protein n=1 Tax=Hermetia illucens TaxID=343691 RepID=A0A7R8UNT8_HERIL|nr:unnamed protein product [Hermetia illucens]
MHLRADCYQNTIHNNNLISALRNTVENTLDPINQSASKRNVTLCFSFLGGAAYYFRYSDKNQIVLCSRRSH